MSCSYAKDMVTVNYYKRREHKEPEEYSFKY